MALWGVSCMRFVEEEEEEEEEVFGKGGEAAAAAPRPVSLSGGFVAACGQGGTLRVYDLVKHNVSRLAVIVSADWQSNLNSNIDVGPSSGPAEAGPPEESPGSVGVVGGGDGVVARSPSLPHHSQPPPVPCAGTTTAGEVKGMVYTVSVFNGREDVTSVAGPVFRQVRLG